MSSPSLVTSSHFIIDRVYTLSEEVPAMQVLPSSETGARLSPALKLPRGANVRVCGAGFDDQTVKVLYEGQCYILFSSDVEHEN